MGDTEATSNKYIQRYFQIMQSMDTLYEEYARKNNLTFMSLYVLEILYEFERCTQKEIAKITLTPKQTVNMVIRSFSEKGWVILTTAVDDRRNKFVELTKEGRAVASKIIEPFWNAGTEAFSELDAKKRDIMLEGLSEFENMFTKRVKNLKCFSGGDRTTSDL